MGNADAVPAVPTVAVVTWFASCIGSPINDAAEVNAANVDVPLATIMAGDVIVPSVLVHDAS